ncbi:glycosyltransferase [Micromonospora sp. NBC_00617]|uniref:glycosyltransferase n=1 Tax=Micromonospora sp. NBC_00617 TaxID=2903587 RepID=UPI0030E28BC3
MTPWYPTRQRPFNGAFVQAMVEATAPGYDRVRLYHSEEWGHRLTPEQGAEIERRHLELMHRSLHWSRTVGGAEMLYVPVPLIVTSDYAVIARRHEVTLRAALGGQPIDAPVVHAHVGLPGGWAALQNARPDARVFVTEHATFLNLVLAQPEARAMYDEVLHRCAGLFAVGDPVRDPLVEAFPHHAHKISYVPNPVSFGTPRPAPVEALRRWLYVGQLNERKGVLWLVEAFAAARADDPTLTLTMVGEGPQRAELDKRAAELGVTDAVTYTGAVPPDEALRLMREHDLLVHPSRFETFGMTIVEAVAAGMPVLVTKCGGPEETLRGVADKVAELVEVEEAPDALLAGYRRLRDRFDRLDITGARRDLAARYSYEATAEAHRRAWFPAEAAGSETTEQGVRLDG